MSIQVVPNRQSFGGSIGASLGSGLGRGLSELASHKMKQLQAAKTSELFQNAGYTPEASQLLGHLEQTHPEHFHQIVSHLGSGGMQSQQQQQPLFGSGSGGNDIQHQKLQQARELADEKKNEPFLKGQSEDFNNAKRLYSKAKSMLDNLEKNKKKWPGQLRGTITPDKAYTDPDIRKYLADGASLVSALASSRKGQPTNFKIKFEQLSKPDLTMPYDTQKDLLKSIIKDSEDVFKVQKFIGSEKQKYGGKLPGDIREKLVQSGLGDIVGEASNDEYKGQYRKNKATGITQQWNPQSNSYEDINPEGL